MSVLFSHGSTDYQHVKTLPDGPYPRKNYLCQPRTGDQEDALVEVAVVSSRAHRRHHERLEETAVLGLRLAHPGLPRTQGLYQNKRGAYLVTQYVPGVSLNMAGHYGCMRQRHLSESFTLYVASRVAGALSHVHGLTNAEGHPLNLVHRGVHPYHIILGLDGRVVLARPEPPSVPWGGLDFAAPERLCPEPGEEVDARSDFFSLGLVMLELTTGQQLYALDEVEQAAARLPPAPSRRGKRGGKRAGMVGWTSVEEMARRAAAFRPEHIENLTWEVSRPVRRIVHRLLRRQPSERYATAAALKADLDACLAASREPYGPQRALEELREAQREAEEYGPEFIPSDEAERGSGGELLALRH
jgi:serine/threonine protein kinase